MHRLTHEEGLAIFTYIKAHPKASTAALVKRFRTSSSTIGRIRKGTWRAHPNAAAGTTQGKAKLVRPTKPTFVVPTTMLTPRLVIDLATELNASLDLLTEVAGKMGFEPVVHFKAK